MGTISINVLRNLGDIFKHAKETGRLWMVNTSDKGNSQIRGDVMMAVRDEADTDIPIMIPATWLPVDLLEYTSVENFERSTNLRNYLRAGLLSAIDDKTATALMQQPNAAAERARVAELTANARNAVGPATVDGKINLNTGVSGPMAKDPTAESPTDLAMGNTDQVKSVLRQLESTPREQFVNVRDSLVNFLVSASDVEVKALAAGLSDFNNPAFTYIDATLNAYVEGTKVNSELFDGINVSPTPSAQSVSFSVNA